MRKIWMRLGVSLRIPDKIYERALLGDDDRLSRDTLIELLKNGQFDIEGDSYIPQVVLSDYNYNHGTNYCEDGDCDFDFLRIRRRGK